MKNLNPRQCVEIFHLCFLDLFGRKTDKCLYALKGGCNLRFYFNSFRYSEDMDIDVQTIAKSTLSKKVATLLDAKPLQQSLATKGIVLHTWSSHKQTETTQRWKIQLQLSHNAVPINTKIEFSRRTVINNVCFQAVNLRRGEQYSLGPILSNHYNAAAAYQQKIRALIGRSQTQARDIFDLYLLLSHDVETDIVPDDLKKNLEIAISNLSSISHAEFISQVVSYLMPEYQEQYQDEDVWNAIQMQVYQAIEEAMK